MKKQCPFCKAALEVKEPKNWYLAEIQISNGHVVLTKGYPVEGQPALENQWFANWQARSYPIDLDIGEEKRVIKIGKKGQGFVHCPERDHFSL